MKTNLWPDYRRWVALMTGVVLSCGIPISAAAASTGQAETLQAIRAVENPSETPRPGRYGELGAYQFRKGTWRMYTSVPFERAIDRSVSEEVAVKHYDWIKRGLVRNGLAPSAYNIALAWNGGLMAAVRGRASSAAHDYATRVNNLAQEFHAARLASAN